MKVFELAKEIGVPSSDVVALLKENEVPVKNHMTPLSDEAIEMVRANYITVQDEPEKVEVKEPKKVVKTDADYRPEEMIPCRSLFAGVLLFTGDHTHM